MNLRARMYLHSEAHPTFLNLPVSVVPVYKPHLRPVFISILPDHLH